MSKDPVKGYNKLGHSDRNYDDTILGCQWTNHPPFSLIYQSRAPEEDRLGISNRKLPYYFPIRLK